MLQLLWFALGIVVLYFGAEWLVRGSCRLARSYGISALVVGLTVVAFGTSAPELVVTLIAALSGRGDVTVGNVIGSNISNIALILGLAAVIYPLRVTMNLLRRGIPLMLIATAGLGVLVLDGTIGRGDGLLLLLGLALYFWILLRSARTEPKTTEEKFATFDLGRKRAPAGEARSENIGLVAVGLVSLAIGAHLLVDSATYFARHSVSLTS